MTKLRIGILFGGYSGEHQVSIISAQAIAQGLTSPENLDKYEIIPIYINQKGYWESPDIANLVLASGTPSTISKNQSRWNFPEVTQNIDLWFPITHGPNGEDGTLQGLLKSMQIPFVGSGVLASALGMDKLAMKMVFAQAGLSQVKYIGTTKNQLSPSIYEQIETELGYPCFVKPANLGSSVGISKVRTREQLKIALNHAASLDHRIIVEAAVIAREVECAVLGNSNPKASVIGEITYQADFYDYETKYTEGRANLIIPASLPNQITQQIQEMSIKAFLAINARGLSRVDFFYVESTQELFINEINTLPGFTSMSMYPVLWQKSGIPFPQLIDQLIQLALEP